MTVSLAATTCGRMGKVGRVRARLSAGLSGEQWWAAPASVEIAHGEPRRASRSLCRCAGKLAHERALADDIMPCADRARADVSSGRNVVPPSPAAGPSPAVHRVLLVSRTSSHLSRRLSRRGGRPDFMSRASRSAACGSRRSEIVMRHDRHALGLVGFDPDRAERRVQ